MGREGFWVAQYTGKWGRGAAVLVLDTGKVVGCDAFGGVFDGAYSFDQRANTLEVSATWTATVPVPLAHTNRLNS